MPISQPISEEDLVAYCKLRYNTESFMRSRHVGGLEYWSRGQGFGIRVALWFPLALFVAYPTIVLNNDRERRHLRHRRRKEGLCPECAYNLKGNVSGVCPECGERI